MPNKKIVFVTYGGGHVNMLVPVIKELQKQDNLELIVLGLTTAGSVLKNNNIPYIGFKDLLKDNDDALKWGKKLVNKNDLHDLVSYEESVAYMGLSYVDMERNIGTKLAASNYKKNGRTAFLPTNVLESFFQDIRPDLVVTTISPRAEEAAVYAARNLNIPCICLVDLFSIPSLKRASQPCYADRVCVISNDVKDLMASYGRDEEDILVTGNPAFDTLKKPSIKQKAQQVRLVKKWEDKKVILWASQIEPDKFHNGIKGNPDLPREIEHRLVELVNSVENFHLVIRPHPNESYKQQYTNQRVETCKEGDIPLHVLLKAVDLVVIMTSTVGLEARLLGTPVVSIDLSIFSNDTPYSGLKISTGVSSLYDLNSTIINVLNRDHKECASNFPEIGKSTNNVVSVINQFIKK